MVDGTSKGLTVLGWSLIAITCVVVAVGFVYVFFMFLLDPVVPSWIKVLICIGMIGIVILFVVVIRDRLKESKDDPYKDIEI